MKLEFEESFLRQRLAANDPVLCLVVVLVVEPVQSSGWIRIRQRRDVLGRRVDLHEGLRSIGRDLHEGDEEADAEPDQCRCNDRGTSGPEKLESVFEVESPH